ncbi:UNVERIFIED_CONTAM: hypothetical protein RMT77_007764 [Armadillidium vulgare]
MPPKKSKVRRRRVALQNFHNPKPSTSKESGNIDEGSLARRIQECEENDPPLASGVQEYVEEDSSRVRRELEYIDDDPPLAENISFLEKEDNIDQDLESCLDSDDDLERLVLDLSKDEDEEVQKSNSVQRRKDIISEFDCKLLQSRVSLDDKACETEGNEYVLMKSNQLSELIGADANCNDCGGRNFTIEKAPGKYDLASSQYKLKCMNITCGIQTSQRACNNKVERKRCFRYNFKV